MENLAGNRQCDQIIRKELLKAGVDIVQLPNSLVSEVPASIVGKLGGFEFHRAWYYWVVKGQVPLNVARELYENPNGREDIRVVGHAGCPSPEEWAEHYDAEGKRLLSKEKEIEILGYEKDPNLSDRMKEIVENVRATTRYVEDPLKEAVKSVITSYHIDTQEGLNFFIATLRKHGVIPPQEEYRQ